MTLRDLYFVSDINLKVLVAMNNEILFHDVIGRLRYSQMDYIIVDISQDKDGLIIIIVKEK